MNSDKYKECAADLERLGMTPGFPPLDRSVCVVGANYLRDLIAEVERLRNTLTDIKCDTGCANDCLVGREDKKDYHARDCTKWIGEIADAALKGDE